MSVKLDKYRVTKHKNDFKDNKRQFILSPSQWNAFKPSISLSWTSVPLCQSSISSVPKTRGVYAHSINISTDNMPPTNYITYVGLVGDRKPAGTRGNLRHLRQRFTEYLREQNTLIRPLIHEFLSTYKDHTTFHYVEIPDYTVSLHDIETALLDALLPPCNQSDFSINIKQAHQIATTS